MQGIRDFISTEKKISYINQLLRVGFDVIDFGSFVSPKVIPQMKDTADVLTRLNLNQTTTRLLAIIGNVRGATDALAYDEISYLGYPFSVSETFQRRNVNTGIDESLDTVKQIQDLCEAKNKKLRIYLSMAFGNPYGDPWHPELVTEWAKKLSDLGIRHIALADTIGASNPDNIRLLFSTLIPALPGAEIIAHLHSTPHTWQEKIKAAWESGCRHFDSAIKGLGGCPMAKDELTGNISTEKMVTWFEQQNIHHQLNLEELNKSIEYASYVFPE